MEHLTGLSIRSQLVALIREKTRWEAKSNELSAGAIGHVGYLAIA